MLGRYSKREPEGIEDLVQQVQNLLSRLQRYLMSDGIIADTRDHHVNCRFNEAG